MTVGCSEHTPGKQEELTALVNMHIGICRSLMQREAWPDPRYTVYDINAGAGRYGGNGATITGSPLIIRSALRSSGLRFESHYIEANASDFASLERSWACDGCSKCNGMCLLHHGDHNEVLPRICPRTGRRRLGFIYHDPNGELSINLLAKVSRIPVLERLDIIIYASATMQKRCRGAFGWPRLSEELGRIDKPHWIVRAPRGQQQWTMLVGTRWGSFPAWERRGYYPIGSTMGREVLRRLDNTNKELEAMQCDLPFAR
jgi:hypothetical protein